MFYSSLPWEPDPALVTQCRKEVVEHCQAIDLTLRAAEKHGLVFGMNKCAWFQREGKILGSIVGKFGRKCDEMLVEILV